MEQFLISIVQLFEEQEFRHWFFWTALILGIFAGWSPYGFWRGIFKLMTSRKKTTIQRRASDVRDDYNTTSGDGT